MRRDALRMRARAAGDADVVVTPADTRMDVPQPGSGNYDLRVRETLMTYLGKQGNFLDRGLTVRDLVESGVIKLPPGWTPGGGGGGVPPFQPGTPDDEIDLTPPPDVTGFVATPGIMVVFVETDEPLFTAGHGYMRTNIYGAGYNPATDPLPTFADAQFIFSFIGEVGSWATQPATTFRLWAKWESRDGVESINPVGGTNGVEVTTGQDVAKLVEAMTGPGKPFKEVTEPILLPDGTVVPVGVYISDAYIHRMQVVNAMIMDAAITNAKVANLSADKIKAGSIAVGEFIKSTGYVSGSQGWIITGEGNIEASNAVIRGTVYATAGSFAGSVSATSGNIGGNTIDATGIQSPGYAAPSTGWRLDSNGKVFAHSSLNGGSFTEYAWPPAGQYGYHLSASGLLLGNANNGKYFQVQNGDVYAPQFSIVSGVATFAGALNAATGTFSGNLSAAGGTFAGTLAANTVVTTSVVGAAISSAAGSSGVATAVVSVSVPAGASSIIVSATPTYTYYNDGGNVRYEGQTVAISYTRNEGGSGSLATGYSAATYVWVNPAEGTYNFTATRSGQLGTSSGGVVNADYGQTTISATVNKR